MPDRPIPAYPNNYSPSDLAVDLHLSFTRDDGIVFQPPNMAVVTGDCGTWSFRFENQAEALTEGAVITLVRFNYQIAFALQTEDPHKRDYCTLETDSTASLQLLSWRDSVNLFSIAVQAGTLERGQSVTVRVGDRSGGGAGSEVFWSAVSGQFLVAVDREGDGRFQGARGNPHCFEVVAHPVPDLLRLLGPTVARTGEPYALHLGIYDRNRNIIESFTGEVRLDAPPGIAGVPESLHLTPEDRGIRIIEGVTVDRPGVFRIGVQAADSDVRNVSNPTVVYDEPADYVYWGDVHAHGWGDSTMYLMYIRCKKLDPLSRHLQGRQVGRYDFACPAAMSMDPDAREEVWEAYREACQETDQPGKYVPFLAYEAHPRAGDRQMIFRDLDEPVPLSMRAEMAEVDAAYGSRDDVLLQVHIGGATPLWDAYRPDRERFLEVCSGFGCAEWLLQRALRTGYRPGVCAASDLHLGLMGGPRAVETFRGRFGQKYPMRQRDSSYGTGPVTAIVAPELTRGALWNGIEARNTYATSGSRIYLKVVGNGRPAGEDVEVDDGLSIEIACHGCADIDRVDLIVGEFRAKSWRPGALDFSAQLDLAAAELPGEWAYVRVHQADGEYAWSSPIYLSRSSSTPGAAGLPAWNEDEPVDLDQEWDEGAAKHLPALKEYLVREEDIGRFQDLTPVRMLDLSVGRCAQFFCHWGEEKLPVSIRWYYEFVIPKIRFDMGWRDFGAYDENDLGPELMAKYG
jgi:hypothetical protein